MRLSFSKLSTVTNKITLSKRVIGIDVDDRSIEVAMLEKSEGRPKVKSLGRIVMDFGIIENGRIKNEKKLSKLIRKALERAKPESLFIKNELAKKTKFILSLSDSQVYTQTFSFEINSNEYSKSEFKQELLSKIDKKVKSNIPLENSELTYSYKIIKKNDNNIKVLIVATDKGITKEWYNFFNKIGVKIDYFDIESLAIFRGLLIKEQKLPVCIVDIGASSTLISIFDKSGLYYSYSLSIAGDNLTEELVRKLKIRYNQADSLKEKYGLIDPSKKVFPILIKVLEPIVKEIKVAKDYYKKNSKKDIQGVIMVGGSSKLRGLADYISTNLDIKVWSGNSVLLREKTPLEYIEAIGLAYGGLDKKYADLYLEYKEEKSKNTLDLKNFNIKNDSKKILKSLLLKIKGISGGKKESQSEVKKTGLNQKTLISVFIISVILLGSAFFYRELEREKRTSEIKSTVSQFAQTQIVNIDVLIALNEIEFNDNRVSARVVKDLVQAASSYTDAVEVSKSRVMSTLANNEDIWAQPINAINKNNIIFPLTINWMIYDKMKADELVIKKIDELNTSKSDYILNSIKRLDISFTDNPNIMILSNRVDVSLDEMFVGVNNYDSQQEEGDRGVSDGQLNALQETQGSIVSTDDKAELESEVQSEQVLEEDNVPIKAEEKQILILDTEVGWLNVRTGPGVEFDLIGRVYPAESYPLQEAREKWYKIEVSSEQSGWVSDSYAEIIK